MEILFLACEYIIYLVHSIENYSNSTNGNFFSIFTNEEVIGQTMNVPKILETNFLADVIFLSFLFRLLAIKVTKCLYYESKTRKIGK